MGSRGKPVKSDKWQLFRDKVTKLEYWDNSAVISDMLGMRLESKINSVVIFVR